MFRINELARGKYGWEGSLRQGKRQEPILLGVECGTKLLYEGKPIAKLEKIHSRWNFGIFVGIRGGVGRYGLQSKARFLAPGL